MKPQRYDEPEGNHYGMMKREDGDYILYEDVQKLLEKEYNDGYDAATARFLDQNK